MVSNQVLYGRTLHVFVTCSLRVANTHHTDIHKPFSRKRTHNSTYPLSRTKFHPMFAEHIHVVLMGNVLLLTVCPFSRFLFSMHLQVLTTSDAGAVTPALPLWNTSHRLPPMRLLRLTTAAGTDPTPLLERSRWAGKQTQSPLSPLGFPRHAGLSQAPTNNTATSVKLIHTA